MHALRHAADLARQHDAMLIPLHWPGPRGADGGGNRASQIDSWADSDDVTLFGAWGSIEKGHKAVTGTMRWVGSRFTGAGAVDVEHTVIASSGDLAYTVGFERSHRSVDGGPPHDSVIRATRIYRRIDGDWKLMHRHANFPPQDQRDTSAR